jgi:hypothetical protein
MELGRFSDSVAWAWEAIALLRTRNPAKITVAGFWEFKRLRMGKTWGNELNKRI